MLPSHPEDCRIGFSRKRSASRATGASRPRSPTIFLKFLKAERTTHDGFERPDRQDHTRWRAQAAVATANGRVWPCATELQPRALQVRCRREEEDAQAWAGIGR